MGGFNLSIFHGQQTKLLKMENLRQQKNQDQTEKILLVFLVSEKSHKNDISFTNKVNYRIIIFFYKSVKNTDLYKVGGVSV